jgi:hypothetical protein
MFLSAGLQGIDENKFFVLKNYLGVEMLHLSARCLCENLLFLSEREPHGQFGAHYA